MLSQPELTTNRLILRAFTVADSLIVSDLAGNKLIADVTANIPHPYSESLAKEWIQSHSVKWKNKELASFAITLKETRQVIGAISLMNLNNNEGELGYWVGVDYWNNGYCTEACRRMIDFGFNALKLRWIHAHHLSRNPASGKVLLNSGLSHIGSSESVCGYRKEKEAIDLYEIFNNT
jgi:RimJ/RimL family protein N-acetyltransferase